MANLTTGGSYVFNQSASDLIAGALRLCGAIADEETPTSAMARNCLSALNAMVKGWQVSGIHVWCEEECVLFVQPNQPVYQLGSTSPDHACLWDNFIQNSLAVTAAIGASTVTLASAASINAGYSIGIMLDAGTTFWTTVSGAPAGNVVSLGATLPSQATSGAIVLVYSVPLMRPLRVPQGRRYLLSSTIETPLITMSRLDYDYLPNKYNTGEVTQFFFDPQQGNQQYTNPLAKISLWPSPQNNANAIRFVAQRPIQDITTLATLPDFPQEWLAPLRWNLAVEMAPEFDVPADRFDRLKQKADEWFARVQAWDREPEPIYFGVAFEPAYRT